MVSRLAKADIEKLHSKGVELTVDEIVRLNALGCKVEYSNDGIDIFTMPRCAFLGDICFREATLGHELWMREVGRWMDIDDDIDTMILVRAFTLSKPQDELPDPLDVKKVKKQMDDFFKSDLSKFTPRQVVACLNYVALGDDPNANEYAIKTNEDDDEVAKQIAEVCEADNHSIEIGIVNRGIAMKLGLTLNDYLSMTPSRVQTIIGEVLDRELGETRTKMKKSDALGEYISTLNAIRESYKNETMQNG